jgi:hypothetical protein
MKNEDKDEADRPDAPRTSLLWTEAKLSSNGVHLANPVEAECDSGLKPNTGGHGSWL